MSLRVKSGYDKSKKAKESEFRELTIDELKHANIYPLSYQIKAIDLQGNWRNIKITSVKTWKSRPGNVDVHWKYGLYEYGITSYVDGKLSSGPMLVIEIE